MKTKIMITVLAGVILSLSNPAVAQHTSSDSASGKQESSLPITISWNYPSIFEADAAKLMEESMINGLLPVDSANYQMLLKLESFPEDDHCIEVKADFSSNCASDYRFINRPVMVQ